MSLNRRILISLVAAVTLSPLTAFAGGGLEGFGAYEQGTPSPSPSPTPVPTATPTPSPPATPIPPPAANGSGAGAGALGGLLGGLLGGAGGGGGLFGGGSNPGGNFGGVTDPGKYGQEIDYSKNFADEATKDDKQNPGEKKREVQCEPERKESAQTSNADADNLGSKGDQIIGVYGPEFDDGPVKSIANSTGMQYRSPALGSARSAVLGEIRATAAGNRTNPITGKPQNLVVVYECHGGDDYLQSDGRDGGITGADMAAAINQGKASAKANGKKPGNITIIDGGCFSGRCKTVRRDTKKAQNVHAVTGASPGNYAWHSGGQSHIATHVANLLSGQAKPAILTKGILKSAVGNVGNGAYGYRVVGHSGF